MKKQENKNGMILILYDIYIYNYFYRDPTIECYRVGKAGDSFYHIAILAGNAVLFNRTQAIIPRSIAKHTKWLHLLLTVARFLSGVLDVIYVNIHRDATGICDYEDNVTVNKNMYIHR